MKKFSVVLAVMLLVAMLATSAFAASITGFSYKNGVVRFTVSGLGADEVINAYVDGSVATSVSAEHPDVQKTVDWAPGTKHCVGYTGNKSAYCYTVPGAPATDTPAPATDTPAPATDTPAPATDTPAPATDTPAPATDTPAPATTAPATTAPATTAPATTAPATTAPATNTPAPATATPAPSTDDDDEVPKTGDSATASYLMGGAMVLAAAYLLLRRRVHSK